MSSPDIVLSRLIWQQVYWPQQLDEAVAINLLRHWASQVHAPQVILEARATKEGLRYLIGTQRRHMRQVRRDVEALVPGTIVTDHDSSRVPVLVTRRISVSTPAQSLTTTDQHGSTRSLVASLTAVQGSEVLVVQVVLGTRLGPTLPPNHIARVDQGLASLVLTGIQPERRKKVQAQVSAKQSDHGFASIIRLGVSAADENRRRTLMQGVLGALRSLAAPGLRLREHGERVRRLNSPSSEWSWYSPSQRLSVAEVSLLTAWPIGNYVSSYPGQPPAHPRPVRPSFVATDRDRIIGESTAPGTQGDRIGISVEDSRRHLWTMGPTGTGKSSLLLSLIYGDFLAGRPVVVIEPKDLVRDLLRVIPRSRRDDVVLLDPLDKAPVGINPLDLHGRSPTLLADQVFGTLHSLYGDQLGPRSSDILRHSLQALTVRADASLAMVPILLTNPGFRRSVVQQVARSDPFAAGPFWHWFDRLSPEASAQVTAPLMNKLRPLLDPHLRHVLAQRRPRFNVRQVLSERKILLVPLQKGTLGPEAAEVLGALVVSELWQALQERASWPVSKRDSVMVYLDEVQEYLRLPVDLGDALAMSRSLGAAFHVAHQYLDQLPASMRTAFEANCRSRVFFQLAGRDARAAASMAPGLEADDFASLPARHVYAQLVHNGAVTDWASARTLDVPQSISRPADIRAHSRSQFGQPIDAIEKVLLEILDISTDDTIGGSRRRRSAS